MSQDNKRAFWPCSFPEKQYRLLTPYFAETFKSIVTVVSGDNKESAREEELGKKKSVGSFLCPNTNLARLRFLTAPVN